MKVLVDQFLDYVAIERGLSENTCKAYRADLVSFTADIQGRGIRTLNEVERDHVIDYLMGQKEHGLSTRSIARRLVSIKIFFRYLQQEGLLPRDVTEVMDSPKLWKILPDTLSMKEIDRLIASPDPATPLGRRDKAILETFYATGLRVSELCTLRLDDLYPDMGYLRCFGKGNKERVVPIGKTAISAVKTYIEEARPALRPESDEQTLFVTRRGVSFSRQGMWKLIKHHAHRAGITKNVTPHTLRHSFATHLMAHGAPLRMIQEMLGHADIATTQQYTHVDADRLKAVHLKFHPRS